MNEHPPQSDLPEHRPHQVPTQRTENEADLAEFERLVDGEMSTKEYREFLTSLDDEPGGWRQLALTFLEDQALRKELGPRRSPKPDSVVAVEHVSLPPVQDLATSQRAATSPTASLRESDSYPERSFHRNKFWTNALVLAASLLVAFSIGIAIEDWVNPTAPENVVQSRENDATPDTTNLAAADAPSTGSRKGAPPHGRSTPDTGPRQGPPHERAEPPVLADRVSPVDPVGEMTVMVGEPDESPQRMRLPVYDLEDLPSEGSPDSAVFPPEVVEMLRRNGHRIDRQRQWVPITLDDGRQVVVPLDQFEIRQVGRPVIP